MSVSPPGRVLLVDDETDLAQLIQWYLLNAGGEIAVRHTGTDAVEAGSRAEVASSQSSTVGRGASALAIATRWR